jgi:DUF971 family protein
MPLAKSKTASSDAPNRGAAATPKIKGLNEVGRYAVGIQWLDGHDSIFPLEHLRRFCPCNECGGDADGPIPEANQRMMQLSRLGDSGLYISWADGHETLYTTSQLRSRCRCAYCAGEPEKPITGGR